MDKIYERLSDLKKKINDVFYYNNDKITYVIKLLEQGLETITYVKNDSEVGKDELEIVVCFSESIVDAGKSKSWTKNSERLREKLFQLVEQMEKEIEQIKEMIQINDVYADLNEWIESLNIGKFLDQHIGEEQYQTSYEVYVDLRKAIMNNSMSQKQEIYIGKIVDQLDEGRKSLSQDCRIEVGDYELSELIKMIRNHPRFNYRLKNYTDNSSNLEIINESVESEMRLSKRRIMERKLKTLSRNSQNHQ